MDVEAELMRYPGFQLVVPIICLRYIQITLLVFLMLPDTIMLMHFPPETPNFREWEHDLQLPPSVG